MSRAASPGAGLPCQPAVSNAAGTEACPTQQAVSSAQERLPESTVGPAAHRPAEEVSLAASGAAGCGMEAVETTLEACLDP